MTSELAQALVAWRDEKGLSRPAAARRLGVAHTTLRSWEVGAVCPQPLQLRLLAQAFGTDTDAVRLLAGPDRIRTARTSGGHDAAPLCRARLAAGLTMTQLARKVGVNPATVSRWENGLRTPSPVARVRLQSALRLTPRGIRRRAGRLPAAPFRRRAPARSRAAAPEPRADPAHLPDRRRHRCDCGQRLGARPGPRAGRPAAHRGGRPRPGPGDALRGRLAPIASTSPRWASEVTS
jgi:transcriptional regulator with XRE-family HTH domain